MKYGMAVLLSCLLGACTSSVGPYVKSAVVSGNDLVVERCMIEYSNFLHGWISEYDCQRRRYRLPTSASSDPTSPDLTPSDPTPSDSTLADPTLSDPTPSDPTPPTQRDPIQRRPISTSSDSVPPDDDGDSTEVHALVQQGPAAQPTDSHRGSDRWYRWQILIASGVPLILLLIVDSAASKSAVLGWSIVAGGTYLLVPPLLHLIQGEAGNALRSFGLRIGVPLLGAAAGAALFFGLATGSDGDLLLLIGAAMLVTGGIFAGIGLDAAGSLHRESKEPSPVGSTKPSENDFSPQRPPAFAPRPIAATTKNQS